MTILTFPSIKRPSRVDWWLVTNTQTHESPFSGAMQTLQQPGEKWAASLAWETLSATEARIVAAFLAQLGGKAGRFYYTPPHAPRQAAGTGTPLVNGSVQSGSAVSIKGWGASAEAFKAGDFFSYNDADGRPMLYMATADISATGGGVANVSVAPPIRRSVADETAVEISAPVGVFRLVDDVRVSTRPPLLGSFAVDIIEALV